MDAPRIQGKKETVFRSLASAAAFALAGKSPGHWNCFTRVGPFAKGIYIYAHIYGRLLFCHPKIRTPKINAHQASVS